MTIYSKSFFRTHRSIFIVLALASFLYLYQLGENSLWIDEFISIYRAQRLPEGIGPVRPLYYILLRFWMGFGMSVEWLRGLSVILGVSSVFLVYRLGFRVANESVGIVAAVLSACSPLFINHVQEVRMYPLGNVLSLLGSLLLLEALRQPTALSIGKWAIARTLAVLTIPLSILLLGPDCLIIGWQLRHHWQKLQKFIIGLGLMGIALVPSAFSMVFKAGPGYVNSWTADLAKPGLVAIVSKLTSLTAFWPLASLPPNLSTKLLYYIYTLALAVIFFLALSHARKQPKLLAPIAWALIPAIAMLVFSYLFSPIWNGRYLLFLSPYVFILLAVGFTNMWYRHRQLALSGILIYALAVGGGFHQYYQNWDRDNWKAAVETINQQSNSSDAIAVYAPLPDPRMAIDFYYKGNAPVYAIDHFQGNIDTTEVKRVLDNIPSEANRLWLVFRGFNGNAKANKVVRQTVEAHYTVESSEVFEGPISVMLVTHSPVQAHTPSVKRKMRLVADATESQ